MSLLPETDEEWGAVQNLLARMRNKPKIFSELTYEYGQVWARVLPNGEVNTTSKRIEECEIRGKIREMYEE